MSSPDVSDAAFIRSFLIVLILLIIWTVASAILGRVLASNAEQEQLMRSEAVSARIKPTGSVSIGPAQEQAPAPAAQTAPPPAPVAPPPKPVAEKPVEVAAAPSGETVYQTACFACHGTGLPNVPKLGDATAWEPRAAKGMDALMESAIKGLGAMPPRAGNPKLSDAELEAAIDYMLKESGVSAG
ncbi:MAG: c-type cytochrome [Pseudomonadota bacterium]